MAAKGDKVQWRSGHNPDHWFKGIVLYVVKPERPRTSATCYAVIDDGTGLTPRVIQFSRLIRRHA